MARTPLCQKRTTFPAQSFGRIPRLRDAERRPFTSAVSRARLSRINIPAEQEPLRHENENVLHKNVCSARRAEPPCRPGRRRGAAASRENAVSRLGAVASPASLLWHRPGIAAREPVVPRAGAAGGVPRRNGIARRKGRSDRPHRSARLPHAPQRRRKPAFSGAGALRRSAEQLQAATTNFTKNNPSLRRSTTATRRRSTWRARR